MPYTRFQIILVLFVLACGLAGCGGQQSPKQPAGEGKAKTAEKPPAPPKEVTGREAFQNMYVAARAWAPDALPYQLKNFYVKESSRGIGGRSPAWSASFASRSLRKAKSYSYATEQIANIREGVFAGHDERYGSESELGGTMFPMAAVRTDTEKVFETAEAKGGTAFRKKNPDAPITYQLEHDRASQQTVWRVCYDVQCSTSPFTVTLNAATGGVMKVSK